MNQLAQAEYTTLHGSEQTLYHLRLTFEIQGARLEDDLALIAVSQKIRYFRHPKRIPRVAPCWQHTTRDGRPLNELLCAVRMELAASLPASCATEDMVLTMAANDTVLGVLSSKAPINLDLLQVCAWFACHGGGARHLLKPVCACPEQSH
jgi:hypothetical protein